MRLFFAIPIGEEIKRIVSRSIEDFPIADPPWKWIRSENYHITLKFLGETDERMLDSLIEVGRRTATEASPFELSFGRFGAFPSISKPRVLLFRAESGVQQLAGIAGTLEERLEPLGFERERRRFSAHLTLARVKGKLGPHALKALEGVPPLPSGTRQEVDRIMLMRSVLSRSGAVYEEVGVFEL
jgi:2'-5' RNA ligase